jgi:hypothetical protein
LEYQPLSLLREKIFDKMIMPALSEYIFINNTIYTTMVVVLGVNQRFEHTEHFDDKSINQCTTFGDGSFSPVIMSTSG